MKTAIRQLWISLILVLFSVISAQATTYYLSPSGSNGNSGTSAGAPWLTFAYAIPLLSAGDTLILLDGTYTVANSGIPQFTCGTSANNGTSGARITLKAQNERRAHIHSDGTLLALFINQCSYWTIEGIYFSSADNPTNYNVDGGVVAAHSGDHLIFRRLIVSNNNRYYNGHGLSLVSTNNSLVEECETYWVHRHGIIIEDGNANIFRRNYVNSRNYADVSGGRYSDDPNRGDGGIVCYPCYNSIFENNISEGNRFGFEVESVSGTINNKYLGDIALNNGYGHILRARSENGAVLDSMPQDTQITNFLAVGTDFAPGLYMRANKNTRCDNCSFINHASGAILADSESCCPGDGNPTVYGTNILITNPASYGFSIQSQSAWAFDEVIAYNTPSNSPALSDSHYTNTSTINPGIGSCLVYIPAGSAAKGSGVGGADIGANILYRYENGTLTTTPLWDPTTSRFPCGAIVAGVNDIAGSSCFDVHARLNVNTNGCALPGTPPSQPAQLAFVDHPQSTTTGSTLPSITVHILSSAGFLVSTATNSVTLAEYTTGAAITGTTTRAAVNGVATFTGLSFASACSNCRMQATSTGLTSAISNTFTISNTVGSATQLIWGTQPQTTQASSTMPAVTVRVADSTGATVTSATNSVTLTEYTTSATISGTTTHAAVNGVATFTGLSIATAGSNYRFQATASGLTSVLSNFFSITSAAPSGINPPQAFRVTVP